MTDGLPSPPHATNCPIALDHVAIGVHRLAEAGWVLGAELGGRACEGGPGPGFRWGQWRFAEGGRLELIEPAGPPRGFLHRFLERQGPGVHHVTFKVENLAEVAERLRRLGVELVGYDDANPGWKEAFLHPKQAQGIVIQLAESIPGLDENWDPAWEGPPPPENPPPAAQIVALHLSAKSAPAARRQWRELLGGACAERPERLLFRWPESPIGISVAIDPNAREGPRWIEITTPRPVPSLEAPHPVLGTAFRRV